jgi:hypothetical protein
VLVSRQASLVNSKQSGRVLAVSHGAMGEERGIGKTLSSLAEGHGLEEMRRRTKRGEMLIQCERRAPEHVKRFAIKWRHSEIIKQRREANVA